MLPISLSARTVNRGPSLFYFGRITGQQEVGPRRLVRLLNLRFADRTEDGALGLTGAVTEKCDLSRDVVQIAGQADRAENIVETRLLAQRIPGGRHAEKRQFPVALFDGFV